MVGREPGKLNLELPQRLNEALSWAQHAAEPLATAANQSSWAPTDQPIVQMGRECGEEAQGLGAQEAAVGGAGALSSRPVFPPCIPSQTNNSAQAIRKASNTRHKGPSPTAKRTEL